MDEKVPPDHVAPSVAKTASTSRRVFLFGAELLALSPYMRLCHLAYGERSQ